MKPVFFWDCKTVQVGAKVSGVFSTKVAENAPGARHDKGQSPDGSIVWDNWYRDATAIRGHLRWIDIVLPNFTGATAQVVMFFENEKAVHRISVKYNAANLNGIINNLWGVGKSIPTHFFQAVGYEVYPKKKDGKPVVNDKGQTVYNKHLSFADVTPHLTYEKWKEYEETNNLQWVKIKKAGGKEEWDTSAALKFWDSQVISIQRMLLKAGTALPFSYGSIIVTGVENPSGGGNLEAHEIAECQRIYERIRNEYKMPFGRVEIDADSIMDTPVVMAKTVNQNTPSSEDFPEDDFSSYQEDVTPVIDDSEILPF